MTGGSIAGRAAQRNQRYKDVFISSLADGGTRSQESDIVAIPYLAMASGSGHDAPDFVDAGIPAAMIFVRDDKGSHIPDEAMEIADFMQAMRVLANVL